MQSNQICFCGSKVLYTECCKPLINKVKLAEHPEQLMRSRFSAYAVKDYQYIYDTYAKECHTSLHIDEIKESAEDCHWIALVIHNRTDKSSSELEGFVEFSAYYISHDSVYEMREKSRFIREEANNQLLQWRYVDGTIIAHTEQKKISRKQICPCNDYPTAWPAASNNKNKKYKQCCAKYLTI